MPAFGSTCRPSANERSGSPMYSHVIATDPLVKLVLTFVGVLEVAVVSSHRALVRCQAEQIIFERLCVSEFLLMFLRHPRPGHLQLGEVHRDDQMLTAIE